jgi:hypothetical protein
MEIDPFTGQLTWIPGSEQALGVFPVTVRVTDDGFPPLSTTRTFSVSLLQMQSTIDSIVVLPDGTVVLTWIAWPPDRGGVLRRAVANRMEAPAQRG